MSKFLALDANLMTAAMQCTAGQEGIRARLTQAAHAMRQAHNLSLQAQRVITARHHGSVNQLNANLDRLAYEVADHDHDTNLEDTTKIPIIPDAIDVESIRVCLLQPDTKVKHGKSSVVVVFDIKSLGFKENSNGRIMQLDPFDGVGSYFLVELGLANLSIDWSSITVLENDGTLTKYVK